MVYTGYFSQFSAIEGFGLNFSFIFTLEKDNLLDIGFCRRASFGEGSWFLRAAMDLQRRFLPGNSGSRWTDVPVLDWDEQGLHVVDIELGGETGGKEHAGVAVLLLSFFSRER